ncbi:MAG: hypothetical protein KatS3mg094_142 [Candidatus Parcubacteria bacterium]|nr:MAG: hypothetical protein KatS3mg094_142 [Candidatus Parcubacteria bacterium]
MTSYYKYYKNFIYSILTPIFLLLPYISIYANNCINYLAGIGDLEFKDNLGNILNLSTSLYNSNNLKINYDVDYTNKTNGIGSLKITIERNGILDTTTNRDLRIFSFRFYRRSVLPTLEANGIISEFRNYYPKSGDRLKISFDLKTNNFSNNLFFRIRSIMKDNRDNNEFSSNILSTSTSIVNWTNFVFSTTVIDNIAYEGIYPFYFEIYAKFPDSNTSSQAIFWIDNIKVEVERFNSQTNSWQCLTLPQRNNFSSLKFLEVFHSALPYTHDWINYYTNFEMIDSGLKEVGLKVFYHNKNFKLIDYLYPAQIKFRESEVGSFRFKRNDIEVSSLINLDDTNQIINDISTTSWWNGERMFKLTPNSGYPEIYLLSNFNSDTLKVVTSYYRVLNGFYENNKVVSMKNYKYAEFYNKYIFKHYIKEKNNNYFWGFRLDSPNINYSESNSYRHAYNNSFQEAKYFSIINIYKEIVEKLKFTGKKVFTNFGYRAYFTSSSIHIGIDKFLDGFMNEGFLINRNLIFKSPTQTHYEIQSVIENFNNKYSLLMSYTNRSWCTTTNSITNYLISSFYLVNNNGVYISFEMPLNDIQPGSSINISSNELFCQIPALYLDLGNPEEVNNINQIIVASSSNFNQGALYRRRYKKGLVLLNTSDNLNFNYILSSTTEPFIIYKDQLGNIYDFLNETIDLLIPPRNGIILYYPFL